MMDQANRWNAATIFFVLATACLGTYVLWVGASILIPIVSAGLVWFALVSIARLIQQVGAGFGYLVSWLPGLARFSRQVGHRVPPEIRRWFDGSLAKAIFIFVSHVISWLILIFLGFLFTSTVSSTVIEFTAQLPQYELQLASLAGALVEWLEAQATSLTAMMTGRAPEEVIATTSYVEDIQNIVIRAGEAIQTRLPAAATGLLSATQSSIVLVTTVLIYMIFFYSESSSFPKKLIALNREEEDHSRWSALIALIIARLAAYIRIKTVTSALTGGLGYVLMASLNVNFAVLFALLLFLLNYIPIIGSLISSLLPIVLFLVDPDFTLTNWVILIIGLLIIQQGIGSVLEPRLLANSFNISSILVMASLLFWGSIWGVFGMFISAPITAAIVILLANFQGSRQLAILLSADGNINDLRARG